MSSILTNVPSNEHIMILYKKDDDRNHGVVKYINQGLQKGIHCIIASVSAYDSKNSSSLLDLSLNIDNYRMNIERGELCIIDFKSYYDSALHANFHPFKKLKMALEETLNRRKLEGKKDEILILSDVACLLFQNKHFHESEILESWWKEITNEWRENNKHITVICPHNRVILNNPILSETIIRIGSMHTRTIDLSQSLEKQKKQKKNKRILIVEPEGDIQILYSRFLKDNGFKDTYVNIINFGIECLELLFLNKDDGNNNEYDMIILDTHLPDISGFEVAKRIRDKLPNLKIILTTTYSLNNIGNSLDLIGIKAEDVFQKPFSFAELISVIEEQ